MFDLAFCMSAFVVFELITTKTELGQQKKGILCRQQIYIIHVYFHKTGLCRSHKIYMVHVFTKLYMLFHAHEKQIKIKKIYLDLLLFYFQATDAMLLCIMTICRRKENSI